MRKNKTQRIKGSGPKLPVLGIPQEPRPPQPLIQEPRPPRPKKEFIKNVTTNNNVAVIERRTRSRSRSPSKSISRSTSKSRSSLPKTPLPKFKPKSPDEPIPKERFIRNTTRKALQKKREEIAKHIQENAEKNMSKRTRKLRANIDAAAAAIENVNSDEDEKKEHHRDVNYISKADADKIKSQIAEIKKKEEEQEKEDADIVKEIMVDRVDSLKDQPEKQIMVIKIGKNIEKQLEQLRKIVTEISILDSNRKQKMKYLNSLENGTISGNPKAFTILRNAISQIEEKIIDAEKIKDDLILKIEEEHNKLAD